MQELALVPEPPSKYVSINIWRASHPAYAGWLSAAGTEPRSDSPRLPAADNMRLWEVRSHPTGRERTSWRAQLMWLPIVSIMGSDVHIRAMWVRAPDDQPPACICSACLIC